MNFNPDTMPAPPYTLFIRMTRGERRIADELHKQFGGFKRVVIDVDGEQHEFDADSFIRPLDSYEGASRYSELFGSPERAARTLYYDKTPICAGCALLDECDKTPDEEHDTCLLLDYDWLLEWLRGDAE